jgi:hypothetical protein
MANLKTLRRLLGTRSDVQGGILWTIAPVIPSTTSPTIALDLDGQPATLPLADERFGLPRGFMLGFDDMAFTLRTFGKVSTSATANVEIAIAWGSTGTFDPNSVIATTGARALNSSSSNFLVEATCLWDSDSQILQGTQYSFLGAQLYGPTALTNDLTVSSETDLKFQTVVSTSSAGNAIFSISEFVADCL